MHFECALLKFPPLPPSSLSSCEQPAGRMGEAPTSLKAMAAQVVASASGGIPRALQPLSGTGGSSEGVFKVDPSDGTDLKRKC